MPTDKQRISVILDDELYQQLEEFRYTHRIPSLSKAVALLIKIGMEYKEEPSLTSDCETISITFDKPLMFDVLKYQYSSNADSFSRAARVLIHLGLIGEEVDRGVLEDPQQHALKRNELLLLAEYLSGAKTTEQQEFILSAIRSYKAFSKLVPSADDLANLQNELETLDINRALAEQENASERSSQESAQ